MARPAASNTLIALLALVVSGAAWSTTSPAAYAQDPGVEGVVGASIGYTGRTGGDLMPEPVTQFTGSGDLALHLGISTGDIWQFGITGRAGVGGIRTAPVEEFFGESALSAHHFAIGFETRVFLWPSRWFPLRPYAMAFWGGDRIAAIRSEGTGEFDCDESGCDEREERVFAHGFWGQSRALGLGLSATVAQRSEVRFEVFFEMSHRRDAYGRYRRYARYDSIDSIRMRLDEPHVVDNLSGFFGVRLIL